MICFDKMVIIVNIEYLCLLDGGGGGAGFHYIL